MSRNARSTAGRTRGTGRFGAPFAFVRAGAALLTPLRQVVARHSFSETMSHASITTSPVGESATARGASTMVEDAAFEDPALFFAPRKAARRRRSA